MRRALRLASSLIIAAVFSAVLHEFSFHKFTDQIIRFTGNREQAARTIEKSFFLQGVRPNDIYVFEAVFFERDDRRANLRLWLNGAEIAPFVPVKKVLRIEIPAGSLREGGNTLRITAASDWSYKVLRLKNIYGYSSGFPKLMVLNTKNAFRTPDSPQETMFYPIFLCLFFSAVFLLSLGIGQQKSPFLQQGWPARAFAFLILLLFFFVLIVPQVSKYRVVLHFRSSIHLTALFLALIHLRTVLNFARSIPEKTARLVKEWQEPLAVFAISRLGIYGLGYLSSLVIAKGPWFSTEMPSYFLSLFFKWDSFWHQEVAHLGYYFTQGKPSNIAFFPLYPMLVQFSSFAAGTLRTNGFIISNLAALLAVFFFIKLVRLELGDESTAQRAALYLLIFPGSLFFSYFYSEGLFLFLTLAAFYYARKKQWLAASLFGFFASLTKVIGVLILIPLLLELFEPRREGGKFRINRIRREYLLLILVPLGLLSFIAYCGFRFGDPWAFIRAQAAWGTKALSLSAIFEKIMMLLPFYRKIYIGLFLLGLLAIGAMIWRKSRASLILYPALLITVILFTNAIESIPRQLTLAFPLFMGLAFLGKNKLVHHLLVVGFISLLALFVILSVNGYWFV